ncbi:hypothetical protein LCM4573_12210 [Rhizobium sp. LCM 4573]|nr:hypothetical protein LCM4573_12210 [Rhizobium sp. LCM 4573]
MRARANTPAHDPARPADFSEAFSLHPLMSHPAAAMTAATAIGFGLATQAAGVFFGMLQGAMEAANRMNKALGDESVHAAVARVPAAAQTEPEKKPDPAQRVKTAPKPAKKQAAEKVAKATPAPKRQARGKAAPAAGPATGIVAPADDLKQIAGIGPKLEKVLNDMGVRRFADIAGWSKADVARFDKTLGFEGRIGRDDWIGQAKKLMQ